MNLRGKLFRGRLVLCLLVWALAGPGATGAAAQGVATQLGEAEARVDTASAAVQEGEASLDAARADSRASAERAAPVVAAARRAGERVGTIEADLRKRRDAARAEVARVETENEEAASDRDNLVSAGVGFAVAMLVTAGIALWWRRFRTSTPVRWLQGRSPGRAIGLCVGGGLLMVIVGAALSPSGGVAGAIGVALFFLGFVLPNAFVLARHSLEVEAGRSDPLLLAPERRPRRFTEVIAGVFGFLCLLGLGGAVFAGEDEGAEASAATRARAAEADPISAALVAAETRATHLRREASPLLAAAAADREELRSARRDLAGARRELVSAEGRVDSLSQRLIRQEGRERRREDRERVEQEEAEEGEPAPISEPESGGGCNPNYSGCLDPAASDYDCEGGSGDGPLYTGTVEVTGTDEYGLDSDGDGIACEP